MEKRQACGLKNEESDYSIRFLQPTYSNAVNLSFDKSSSGKVWEKPFNFQKLRDRAEKRAGWGWVVVYL
jgi:hypothetical protein